MRVVIALGGNALLKRGEPMTADVQRNNVRAAAPALASVAEKHQLVLSHGNGPQVGLLAFQGAAYKEVEAYPLDVLGAQTEGMIGYVLEQELGNLLPIEVPFATILTMIEVDPADPAFKDPTKFVGPVYDKAQADAARRQTRDGSSSRTATVGAASSPPRAQTDLRDPADRMADREGRRGDLRRRWWRAHDVRPQRRPEARRRRGRHRQGSRQRVARPRDRRRPLRHGDRRRRRLRRLGHARPDAGSTGSRRTSCESSSLPPGPWARRRGGDPIRRTHRDRAAIGALDEIEAIVDGTAGTQVVASRADHLERMEVVMETVRRPLGGRQAAQGDGAPTGAESPATDAHQPRRAPVRRRAVGRARRSTSTTSSSHGCASGASRCTSSAISCAETLVASEEATQTVGGARRLRVHGRRLTGRRGAQHPLEHEGRRTRQTRRSAGSRSRNPGSTSRSSASSRSAPRPRRSQLLHPAAATEHAVHARFVVLDVRRSVHQPDVLAGAPARGVQRRRDLPVPPDVRGRRLRVLVPPPGRRRSLQRGGLRPVLTRGRRRTTDRQRHGPDRDERANPGAG